MLFANQSRLNLQMHTKFITIASYKYMRKRFHHLGRNINKKIGHCGRLRNVETHEKFNYKTIKLFSL
jgi:hypothetical protein